MNTDSTDALSRICAETRIETARRQRATSLASLRARIAARVRLPTRLRPGAPPGRSGARLRADRGDQESLAVRRPDPSRFRSAVARRGVSGWRRDVPVGADRYAVFSRR